MSARGDTAKEPGAIISPTGRLIRNTDNWVRVWMDEGQKVRDEPNRCTATRAITDDGQLIWMVHVDGKRFAYHADGHTAADAFSQAAEARARRRAVSRCSAELRRLRRKILLGRIKVRPTVADARQAGLCELGITGFLARSRLGERADYPGYFLALMSLVDRQIAYPLLTAHARMRAEEVSHAYPPARRAA